MCIKPFLCPPPPAYNTNQPLLNPLLCKLSPNGSLTLGAGHTLTDGNFQIIQNSTFSGKLSLFRIWGRERSKQEVTSLNCLEGDLVKWEVKHWDTSYCDPLSDPSLQCGEFSLQTLDYPTCFAGYFWSNRDHCLIQLNVVSLSCSSGFFTSAAAPLLSTALK